MPKTFTDLVAELDPTSVGSVRRLLGTFLRYADEKKEPFDFRDCAIGNLLFAGCFLEGGRNFNAAAEAMSRLVNSQAALVNVCMGEDRVLVALKADGELLSREADIVGKQSSVPILDLFFMANPIARRMAEPVAGRREARGSKRVPHKPNYRRGARTPRSGIIVQSGHPTLITTPIPHRR
jgi:hypothetical protein